LGIISQWRTLDGSKELEINSLPRDLGAMALSRDGRWLAVAPFDDASIQIMDLNERRWIHPLQSHRRFVQTIIFTDDSRRLVSGGADGKVVIWRIPEFEEITSFDLDPTPSRNGDEGIAILQYEPKAAALGALTDDGRLHLWKTE
jgi:WD40 repeat protein